MISIILLVKTPFPQIKTIALIKAIRKLMKEKRKFRSSLTNKQTQSPCAMNLPIKPATSDLNLEIQRH